ncbi:MAG: trehalose-phosphatase, partial [Candidatus Saccharimonadales bacterium]
VWANKFTHTLKQDLRIQPKTKSLPATKFKEIIEPFKTTKHRLVLLDYDGVLEPFHRNPKHAEPPASLKKLLTSLSELATVVIISGRSKSELQDWLGDLPVSLVAEHGAFSRRSGSSSWRKHYKANRPEWRDEVATLMVRYAAKTPGAMVETKEASLVWHYRNAQPYAAQKYLVILRKLLKPVATRYGLEVQMGNKILEVRPASINKGVAALSWVRPNTDFVLAVGDDYTDEFMFSMLPPSAFTIKVSTGRTVAKYRMKDVEAVQSLLRKLSRS